MNEIIEHVDARSNPVQTVDETGRQREERQRDQYENQIAHRFTDIFLFLSNRATQTRSGLINAWKR
ncbi:hypothetical protein [Burkholderia stagnalis]